MLSSLVAPHRLGRLFHALLVCVAAVLLSAGPIAGAASADPPPPLVTVTHIEANEQGHAHIITFSDGREGVITSPSPAWDTRVLNARTNGTQLEIVIVDGNITKWKEWPDPE